MLGLAKEHGGVMVSLFAPGTWFVAVDRFDFGEAP